MIQISKKSKHQSQSVAAYILPFKKPYEQILNLFPSTISTDMLTQNHSTGIKILRINNARQIPKK